MSIPDVDKAIIAARGEALTVGGPGECHHHILALGKAPMPAASRLPDVNRAALARQGDEILIGRPGESIELVGKVLGREGFTVRSIIDPCGGVSVATDKAFSIRRPRQRRFAGPTGDKAAAGGSPDMDHIILG